MTALDKGRMTGAEWLTAREGLGLSGDWLAQWVKVDPRSPRRWEADEYRVPDTATEMMFALEDSATEVTDELVAALRALDHPGLLLYRADATYEQFGLPGTAYPARWHRQIAFRARERVPGLRIAFFTDPIIRDPDTGVTWVGFAASTRQTTIAPYSPAELAQALAKG